MDRSIASGGGRWATRQEVRGVAQAQRRRPSLLVVTVIAGPASFRVHPLRIRAGRLSIDSARPWGGPRHGSYPHARRPAARPPWV